MLCRASDPDCVAVTYAWNPQALKEATWDFPIGSWPPNVGILFRALQRSDPKRGPGGNYRSRHSSPMVGVVAVPDDASTT